MTTSLVGRSAELHLVVTSLADGIDVLIGGEAGVGKTALLDAVVADLAQRKRGHARVHATPGVRDIPLGAIGHVVPEGTDPSSAESVARAVEHVAATVGVLAIDDIALLDELSQHVVRAARATGRITVVATARTEHPLSDLLRALFADGGRRFDLARLAADETAHMVENLVAAPVERASCRQIHAATDGLPLAVAELVQHAVGQGTLAEHRGIMRWRRRDRTDPHLAGLIGTRLDALHGDARRAVELVCLAEHLPADVLRRAVDGVSLGDLDDRRLLRTSEGRPGWVCAAHPLVAEAVLAQLGPLRRHERLTELVGVLDAAPIDPELHRRRLVLAAEVDAPIDAAELLGAARWARSHRAGRGMLPLLVRAHADAASWFTALALADALTQLRRDDEAVPVYEDAIRLAGDPVERMEASLGLHRCLRHGLGRLAEATDVLDGLRRDLTDPLQRAQVAATEAEDTLLLGRCDDVVTMWREAAAATGDDADEARYRLTQSAVPALLYAGFVAEGSAAFDLHRHTALTWADRHPMVGVYTESRRNGTLVLAGGGTAVREALAAAYDAALATNDAFLLPLTALPLGMDHWLGDRLVVAERLAREALGTPVDEVRQIASYLLVRILQQLGRDAEVGALCDSVADEGSPALTINTSWVIAARAQSAAALARRPDDAADHVAAAYDQAVATRRLGQRVPAAYLFHDLLRFGRAEQVTEPLTELAAECDAPVVSLAATHAAGVAHRDAAALERGAVEAAAIGLHLFARVMRADADRLRTRRRASTGLTAKEHEVARAAAAGMTDREIAALLVVSVRTVNAHLRSVYAKLGVRGRRDLTPSLVELAD